MEGRAALNAQLSMFDFGALPLALDPEGGITYQPGVIGLGEATAWFEAMREDVTWRFERRQMYDRMLDIPRLVASYDLRSPELPQVLSSALVAVRTACDRPFTHVGLNFYRHGQDSVALHNDKLGSLALGEPIAILSLGASREMLIRPKVGDRKTTRILLEPGSLFCMSHASQRTHDHGIPKTAHAVGPRISCAFRVRRVDASESPRA